MERDEEGMGYQIPLGIEWKVEGVNGEDKHHDTFTVLSIMTIFRMMCNSE